MPFPRDARRARGRRRPALALLALVGLLAACAEKPRVRVVLLTLDTLRYDSLAGVGSAEGRMPRLAAWADEAAWFERFYAATPSTQPSHASMFTGLHPWQHGVSRNRQLLDERFETVAEILRDAGFETAAVVASFPVSRTFGFAQGFQRFEDDFGRGRVGRQWRAASRSPGESGGAAEPPEEEAFFDLAGPVLERALAQLDAAGGRRQFFWFHFFDPHSPYGDTVEGPTLRPREVLRRIAGGADPARALLRARHLYDLDVTSLDDQIAILLDRLREDEERYDTHVVVTADHGESFGEDGSMAHGRRLTPSQIHVPLLVRSSRLAPGRRPTTAGSVDVAPTLLALAGVERRTPGGHDLTAPRRRPGAFGMRRGFDKPFEDRRLDGTVEVLTTPLYYMVSEEGRLRRGDAERLLPALGPEARDGVDDERLRALFAAFDHELRSTAAVGIDDRETLEALRALGYTQ